MSDQGPVPGLQTDGAPPFSIGDAANPGPQPGNPFDLQGSPLPSGDASPMNDGDAQGSLTSGAYDSQVSPGSGDPFLPGFEPENNKQSPGGIDQTYMLAQQGLAKASANATEYNADAGQFIVENGSAVLDGHSPVGMGARDPGSEPAGMGVTVPGDASPPPQPDIT